MKNLYLLTTDHLEETIWFRDDEDFKTAMNYMAIQAACCQEVIVLAFILMSNHVHIILKGDRKDVKAFFAGFKQRYAMYMRKKYGVKEFLRYVEVDIRSLPLTDEAPEKAIAYVQMNCVAANICSHPGQYPWGTGSTFFNQDRPRGIRLGKLSGRARFKMLHTECDLLPYDWILNDNGYIDPRMYVDLNTVESLFRTPKRMNYFLQTSSKARKRLERAEEDLPAFRDQTILLNIPDLLRSMFRKESFRELSSEEQLEFARQLRFRFASNINQVARVCGLTYAEAAHLFDNI